MSSYSKLFWIAWLALSLLAAGASTAPAQDAAPGPSGETGGEPALVVETRDLLQSIRRDSEAFRQLMTDAESATGEDLELLERRRLRSAMDLLARIDALVENVVELETRGLDASEFRAVVEPMLREVDPIAHRRIDELREEIRDLAAQRDEATGEDRLEIESRIQERDKAIDVAFRAALDNIENMEALGLDAAQPRAHLAEVLGERAETLVARIDLELEQIATLEERLSRNKDDAELQAALQDARSRKDAHTTDLANTIEMMRGLDLDATAYQQTLIRATGQITTDILDTEVALGLFEEWIASARQGIVDGGPRWVFRLLVFVAILLGFHLLARIVMRIVRRAVSASRLQFSQLLQSTFVTVSGTAVRLLGLLIALSQLGFSLGPVLAGLGIAGFIVGFALQDTLGNFAAGMMILIYRPYDVGDLIETSGAFGTVSAMTLVSTTILTIDHQTLVVPNGKIWGDVIKNVTAQKVRRVDMTFGISYGDDIPHAERVFAAILEEHPKVLDDPPPVVRLHNLGDSSVDFVVRPWVKTADYWEVYWDVTREVKMRFDREGLHIPFPQRDVHLHEERPAAG